MMPSLLHSQRQQNLIYHVLLSSNFDNSFEIISHFYCESLLRIHKYWRMKYYSCDHIQNTSKCTCRHQTRVDYLDKHYNGHNTNQSLETYCP
jgi:hypothetical protein